MRFISHAKASFVRYGRITKPATRLMTLVGMNMAPYTAISLSAMQASMAYFDAEKM